MPTKEVAASSAAAAYEAVLHRVVRDVGTYPLEAYGFLHDGLGRTQQLVHSKTPVGQSHHVTGRQLCEGLKHLAIQRWGRMAAVVLERWNIRCTYDFGRMIFALVDNGLLQKTPEDNIDDFRDVFDFRDAFETGYVIPTDAIDAPPAKKADNAAPGKGTKQAKGKA